MIDDIPTEPSEEPSEEVEATATGPQVLAVGDTYTSPKGGTITLVSIERRTEPLEEYESPPEEGVYLEVLIAGVAGPEGGSLNPFEFTIVDAQGFRYDTTFGETSVPALTSDEIPAGGPVRGAILYDIPDGPVQLVWPSMGPAAGAATWAIP